MRSFYHIFILLGLISVSANSQIILLNEDFGANGSFASAELSPPSSYDLDPVATYLETEAVAINYYGQNNTSDGKYPDASGDNFFLLSNNWSASDVTLTWANMNVKAYSELTEIVFGCAFSGGGNAAWTGAWLFSLEYSFDDVANDPENATWFGIDLTQNATGWPDPTVAGGDNWSLVTVAAGVNLLEDSILSIRIKSNGNYDYHFDDFKVVVKTPTSGMERVTIAKETFGPKEFYRGPANAYENYTNGGKLSFNDYQVHYQNYNNSFDFSYEGNTNDDNWWITDDDAEGVAEDTLVFSVNTSEYADVQLQFGFTYWGGTPGAMVGVYYTVDSIEWLPVTTVTPSNSYPGVNEQRLADGYFHLIKYDDLLPRAENLTLKIFQATAGQFILDDLEITGVFQPLKDDATLSSIEFTGAEDLDLDPLFDASVTEYSVTLPYGSTDAPALEAASTDPEAEVFIENALDVTSDEEADRQSYIYVTSSSGETTLIYIITFDVAANNDASLSEINLGGVALEGFDPGVLNYDISLPSYEEDVPVITATATDSEADISVSDATGIPGVTTIEVTAADGTTTAIYEISFSLAPVAIKDNNSNQILLYPVPFNDKLHIKSDVELVSIRINDITGKLVYHKNNINQSEFSIELSSLPKGIYLIELTDIEGSDKVEKVLKR